MRIARIICFFFLMTSSVFARMLPDDLAPDAWDITGFWVRIDPDTNRPGTVIAVYPYKDKFYGRMVASYNDQGVIDDSIYHPKSRAEGVRGHPPYSGLDFVYDLVHLDRANFVGFVMDPRDGKSYRARVWKEGGILMLRGQVLVFGKSEAWKPFPDSGFTKEFPKPDLHKFVPVIPQPAK